MVAQSRDSRMVRVVVAAARVSIVSVGRPPAAAAAGVDGFPRFLGLAGRWWWQHVCGGSTSGANSSAVAADTAVDRTDAARFLLADLAFDRIANVEPAAIVAGFRVEPTTA